MLRYHFLVPPRIIRVGCCYSSSSSSMANPVPLVRNFVPVEQIGYTSISKSDGFKFSVVSYNILAQAYVKSAFLPHSPGPCLKWKARSQATLTVLKSLEADFLCLQELDEYDTFYKKNLEELGYASIYAQRGGRKRDGCGIFYKPHRAELVISEKIDYNDLVNFVEEDNTLSVNKDNDSLPAGVKDESKAGNHSKLLLVFVSYTFPCLAFAETFYPPSLQLRSALQKIFAGYSFSVLESKKTPADRGDPNDPRVRLKRDCVGVMAAFRLNNPSSCHVIIANTHLYWDPEWADVKIAQARYLLSRLAGFKDLVSNKFDCTPSIIVSGDFNSVPGDQVYQYLVSGTSSVEPECVDDLPMPLSSVYAFTRGEPEFTNCTPGFTGTLDYLFFSPSGDITPTSYLQLPDSESSDIIGGLPNYHHPSDHLPIGAVFEIDLV